MSNRRLRSEIRPVDNASHWIHGICQHNVLSYTLHRHPLRDFQELICYRNTPPHHSMPTYVVACKNWRTIYSWIIYTACFALPNRKLKLFWRNFARMRICCLILPWIIFAFKILFFYISKKWEYSWVFILPCRFFHLAMTELSTVRFLKKIMPTFIICELYFSC